MHFCTLDLSPRSLSEPRPSVVDTTCATSMLDSSQGASGEYRAPHTIYRRTLQSFGL